LRVYAALEIVVAVAALILPFALAASVPRLPGRTRTARRRASRRTRVISLALLGIPAAAMAHVPIAANWYARASATPVCCTRRTRGRAIGAIGAGFLLIQRSVFARRHGRRFVERHRGSGACGCRRSPRDHRRGRRTRRKAKRKTKKEFLRISALRVASVSDAAARLDRVAISASLRWSTKSRGPAARARHRTDDIRVRDDAAAFISDWRLGPRSDTPRAARSQRPCGSR